MTSNILQSLLRKKRTDDSEEGTKLDRVLTVVDLTLLGVGSTLGAGVYVLSGEVGRSNAGPAVVIAFFIAAVSSILSGLCYAEFGARVPKAGSGYVYSYVTMGELCAFTIGWNLVLSYVVGSSSVSKAWSANLDILIGCKLREMTVNYMPYIGVSGLEDYPDLFAGVVILLIAALLAAGAKEFAIVNKVFTGVNICVILFVLVVGVTKVDFHNWNLSQQEVFDLATNTTSMSNSSQILDCKVLFPGVKVEHVEEAHNGSITGDTIASADSCPEEMSDTDCFLTYSNSSDLTTTRWPGIGGFSPYGMAGILSGTATCFYAFVGFDAIATTGEEAINPQRNIPLSIVFSLLICCVAYLLVSATLTLMVPYLTLDKAAPLPVAFAAAGIGWAKYPVGVGAVCALTASLLGCMFPLPRVVMAMAEDGLIFRALGKVSEKTKTPVVATMTMSTLAAILAALFDIKELVDFMSIGTLMAYTLVAASVMILRYRPQDCDLAVHQDDGTPGLADHFKKAADGVTVPTEKSSTVVSHLAMLFTLVAIVQGFLMNKMEADSTTSLVVFLVPIIVMIAIGILISLQCQSTQELAFSVPLIPWVPLFNIWVNVYLMTALENSIWAKLLVWLAIGYAIYFGYGIRNSSAALPIADDEQKELATEEKELLKTDEI